VSRPEQARPPGRGVGGKAAAERRRHGAGEGGLGDQVAEERAGGGGGRGQQGLRLQGKELGAHEREAYEGEEVRGCSSGGIVATTGRRGEPADEGVQHALFGGSDKAAVGEK
jgi:hypothetical protein